MYKGVGATLSIYNLTVDNSQYSTGAITIQNGVDTIQVGWMDIYSGNWWLGVGPNATLIGFWPKKIFTSLAEYGSSVACGGQVYSPPGQSNPPMGSGFRPKMDTRYDAFCAYFNIVNIAHEIEPVMDVEEYSDYDTYKVKDWGVTKPMGHLVVYGGPNKP
ncbi:hypothetical protein Nepgr_004388 [Nepenthes gracilis]|uniref:Neprosin PEP catalytic domain-containing protein n=1 Tax=Nepenthes gracilis TaxID=150966 RepID=A0AAD3XF17_NEPGR|nr:hypothetical protein Nepgr_004388 [Nepenthes gracilis]